MWIFSVVSAFAFLQIGAFFPGYLSHDSAYQWWQARTGEITTLWPPGIVFQLQAAARFHDTAPTVLYVLHSLLYWTCAAYIVMQPVRLLERVLALSVLCVFPIVAVCLPHVWTDVALAMWLLVACVLLDASVHPELSAIRSRWLIGIAALILIGCTLLRHNAWSALPPLCWWAAVQWQSTQADAKNKRDRLTRGRSSKRNSAVLASLLFVAAITTYAVVPRWVSKVHADTWAITLIWDLQALSVASQQVLVPKSISTDATLDDLQQSFDRVNAVTMYVKSRSQWANATVGLRPDQRTDLISAWRDAVAQNPLGYLKHRGYVFAKMLGPKRGVERDGSADDPTHVQFRDNPRVEFANPGALRVARLWVDWLKPQWWASPLVWISSSSAFVLLTYWHARLSKAQRLRRTAITVEPSVFVWLSGILYLLPLFFLVPTADLRYALWPTIASVCAALFALREQFNAQMHFESGNSRS
jgi:hypothetical protein